MKSAISLTKSECAAERLPELAHGPAECDMTGSAPCTAVRPTRDVVGELCRGPLLQRADWLWCASATVQARAAVAHANGEPSLQDQICNLHAFKRAQHRPGGLKSMSSCMRGMASQRQGVIVGGSSRSTLDRGWYVPQADVLHEPIKEDQHQRK